MARINGQEFGGSWHRLGYAFHRAIQRTQVAGSSDQEREAQMPLLLWGITA